MIAEEGLDTDSDAGLYHKSFLQEGEKERDLSRGEIEFEGDRRMELGFEGGRIVLHEKYEKKFGLFTARGMRNQKIKIIAQDHAPSRNPPFAPL